MKRSATDPVFDAQVQNTPDTLWHHAAAGGLFARPIISCNNGTTYVVRVQRTGVWLAFSILSGGELCELGVFQTETRAVEEARECGLHHKCEPYRPGDRQTPWRAFKPLKGDQS